MNEFGVKAVAQKTGINGHTLRIWERRYRVVEPKRTPTGRRVYDRADVEKLTLLAFLVGKGHPISRLATLSIAELESAVAERRSDTAIVDDLDARGAAEFRVDELLLGKLVGALESFQLRELGAQLTVARMQMGARAFTFAIVSPLLARIGQLVNDDRLSIAHEHALSALLKAHIYQMLFAVAPPAGIAGQRDILPAITVATQEGDFHEFGVLLASLLMVSRQFPVHFFGANMPAAPLAYAANALRSPIVLVGKTFPGTVIAQGRPITQKAYLKELDRGLNPDLQIWVGGHVECGATRFSARHPISLFSTLDQLDARLVGIAAAALEHRDNEEQVE
jgi:DNA-binding transcriptional MerR regulator